MVEQRTWNFLVQSTVRQGGFMRLPEPVKRTVATDHVLDGPCVFWYFEREREYVVLADAGLQNERYVELDRCSIYDIDSVAEDGGRIRPPGNLRDAWGTGLEPDDRVFFLSYDAMVDGDVATVFLLTERQLLSLLPRSARRPGGASDAGGLEDSVFDVPSLTDREG